jgi:hypothetical protein
MKEMLVPVAAVCGFKLKGVTAMKSITLAAATLLAGALYVVSPAAKAAVIMFGSLIPTPACGPLLGVGSVCGINETFTSGADTVVAHGFTGAPGPDGGNVNLTLKPFPLPNILMESGLGAQSNNTATTCTDPDCEIVSPLSVSVTRSGSTLITDAVIGSVQAGESFNFFVQTTEGGGFTLLAPGVGSTCVGTGFSLGPVADTCLWNAPPGQTRFGVAVQAVTGNELLTEVSTVPIPGPIVGAGLPGLVAACCGLLALVRRRRKFVV